MIPHIFHWVWLTNTPLPENDKAWMQSWRQHHPDWEFILWAEFPEAVEIEGFTVKPIPPLINQWAYDNIGTWALGRDIVAARSDIVRYEIMLQGGIYLDTDVECFANIEPRLEGVSLFVADEWGGHQGHQGNYMFGASANHPALYTVVRELRSHLRSQQAGNILSITGPFYLNTQLWKYADQLVVFPFMLFSPLSYYHDPDKVEVWPAVTLANHRADGKWYDREKSDPPAQFKAESKKVTQ
ncbi:hypothetical protein EON80_32075 [bacterium]|nr:MAG: hypothetical protein EON80_32075 [bacterium]